MSGKSVAARTQSSREPSRLPGLHLDEDILITADLAAAVRQARDAIVLAVPAQSIREIVIAAAPYIPTGVPIVLAAKGIKMVRVDF